MIESAPLLVRSLHNQTGSLGIVGFSQKKIFTPKVGVISWRNVIDFAPGSYIASAIPIYQITVMCHFILSLQTDSPAAATMFHVIIIAAVKTSQ